MHEELLNITNNHSANLSPPTSCYKEYITFKLPEGKQERLKVFAGFTDFVTVEDSRFSKIICEENEESISILTIDLSKEPYIDLTIFISFIHFCSERDSSCLHLNKFTDYKKITDWLKKSVNLTMEYFDLEIILIEIEAQKRFPVLILSSLSSLFF